MNYYEVRLTLSPYNQQNAEILVALLAELNFDSFADTEDGLLAYITEGSYSLSNISDLCKNLPFSNVKVSYQSKLIENQNWNTKWESNFDPICVEKLCRIRAPFHRPELNFNLEIVIEPKMSFGTGHHQTTWLMVRELFELQMGEKDVLDMGCGTGILAIIAEKLGANSVVAIDNDSWAYENAKENINRNHCSHTNVLYGDASLTGNKHFDIILANINLNILLQDMSIYKRCLNKGGKLIVSGVFVSDVPSLNHKAAELGFTFFVQRQRDEWALIGYLLK
jgi:ribosomal protein L11 methyltransferase